MQIIYEHFMKLNIFVKKKLYIFMKEVQMNVIYFLPFLVLQSEQMHSLVL